MLDRFIQQAILQVLQPQFDPTFSEHSYGFRPGRRAHDAILAAQRYVQAGRHWVVDIDLEKFSSWWRMAGSSALNVAIPISYFDARGLPRLAA